MSGFLKGIPGQLATVLARLTSGRATNLDNLNATVSSRAAAATAVSNADLTAGRIAKLDNLDALVSAAGGKVKSLQLAYVTVTWAGGTAAFGTATISAITTARAIAVPAGMVFAAGADYLANFYPTFVNTTTLRVDANTIGASSAAATFWYWVIEWAAVG